MDIVEEWEVMSVPGKKGRSFPITGLGLLTQGSGGYNSPSVPLWSLFACEDGAIRPVLANIGLGHTILRGTRGGDGTLEFKRSVGYETNVQRFQDGVSVVTVYKPGLFRLSPGPVDPKELIHFVCLPDKGWPEQSGLSSGDCRKAAEKAWEIGSPTREGVTPGVSWDGEGRTLELFSSLVPTACLVAAYLDHRTGCPLLADPGYYLHLFLTLISERMVSVAGQGDSGYRRESRYKWWCDPGMGYQTPIVMLATPGDVQEILARTVSEYMSPTKLHTVPRGGKNPKSSHEREIWHD